MNMRRSVLTLLSFLLVLSVLAFSYVPANAGSGWVRNPHVSNGGMYFTDPIPGHIAGVLIIADFDSCSAVVVPSSNGNPFASTVENGNWVKNQGVPNGGMFVTEPVPGKTFGVIVIANYNTGEAVVLPTGC